MCCKEETHRVLRQLKTKAYWKTCKARKKSCLRQRRKGGRRVSRKNAVGNTCIDATWTMGRKRIAVNSNCHENSAELCSEAEKSFVPTEDCWPVDLKEEKLTTETDIESLPLDILVRIVCNVHHDELKPLSHVSSKFRDAVLIARQMHFDYTTPIRVRAPKRRANSLIPYDSSENCSRRFEDLECLFSSSIRPATPNAPKQVGKFHKSRISPEDMKEIATLLFPTGTPVEDNDTTFVNQNHFLRLGGATNRVLFVEDELCKAVSRNRL